MSAPTDLELMLFHDGELEEPRRSEVAAWLEQSAVGRGKLAGLGLGGELVRETALARAASFDISAAVMAKVSEVKPAEGGKVLELRPKQEKATQQPAPERQDGGRLLLPLTALAAAAAVALFVWGRSGPTGDDVPVAKTQPTETAEPVQPLPPSTTAVVPSPSTELFAKAADEDTEPSVQVASVDFGSRTGAVYYVGGASQGATTTVVWVTEE
jgi:hypothetical protein